MVPGAIAWSKKRSTMRILGVLMVPGGVFCEQKQTDILPEGKHGLAHTLGE